MANTGFTLGNRAFPARLAAAVTVLFGLMSLTGWAFHVHPLTSVLPGAVDMKANTALCFVFCATALLLVARRASVGAERLAQFLGSLAALIGLATLTEYLFGWQLGIDELLLKDTVGAYAGFRGRMSPFSASGFIVLGFALACIRTKALHRPAILAACLGLTIGAVSLIGYLWNANELITDRWLPPVALNTAICLTLLGIGLLFIADGKVDLPDMPQVALAAVEIKILAGFLVAIALLIFGGSFTYHNSVEFADSIEWIAHTQEVRAAVADLYGSVAGAEVAERDYFLTKSQEPLAEYNRLIDRVRGDLDRLPPLIADNAEQRRNFEATQTVVEVRLHSLAAALSAFNAYGVPPARAILALSRKTATAESVHLLTSSMDALEVKLLEGRRAAVSKGRLTTLASLLVTLGAACALFYAFFRGIHHEMLARRGAEQALRDSDQYNRSIIESSPDCVAVLTTGAHITQMTPQGLRLMDIEDFSTIAGTDWCMFWGGEHRAAARAAVAAAAQGKPGRFEGQSATRKGISKWWDVIVMPIRSAAGQPERLIAVARDITEVKATATNLLAANRFLDSLIENLPVMVMVKDAASLNFVRVNRAFENFIGRPRSELLGRSAADFLTAEEADFDSAKDREACAQGTLLDIPRQSLHTADLGARTFHSMKMPIADHSGRPQFLLAISVDISERDLAEEAIRALNVALQGKAAQLESTNKELESFSYSVSHDLRAPLRAIDGFAQILEEDYRDQFDAEGRRYLSVIRQNSKRMGALIDDLLEFSRLGRQPVASLEVNVDSLVREVIQEVLSAAAAALDDHTAAEPQIEIGPLPEARGDRTLLRQVWTNLISNALKYSSKSLQPCIKVSGRRAGGEIHYSVHDNGVGFSMDYVEKLFGVFQRLHRNDEFSGTGVGLAIVHRVVSRHGGRVWAEGKVNDGAVFSFALPTGTEDG